MIFYTLKTRAWPCWSERRAWRSAHGHRMIKSFQIWPKVMPPDMCVCVSCRVMTTRVNPDLFQQVSLEFQSFMYHFKVLLFSCRVLTSESQSFERHMMIVTFNNCFKRNFHSEEKSVHNVTLKFIMSVFLTKIFYNVRFCTRNAQMIFYLEPQIDYILITFQTFQTNILPLLTQTILYRVFFRYDYDKSDCNVIDSILGPLHICLNY